MIVRISFLSSALCFAWWTMNVFICIRVIKTHLKLHRPSLTAAVASAHAHSSILQNIHDSPNPISVRRRMENLWLSIVRGVCLIVIAVHLLPTENCATFNKLHLNCRVHKTHIGPQDNCTDAPHSHNRNRAQQAICNDRSWTRRTRLFAPIRIFTHTSNALCATQTSHIQPNCKLNAKQTTKTHNPF